MLELTLDGLPPNPNRLKGRHWSVAHKAQTEWKTLVAWVAKAKYKNEPMEYAHLHWHISVGDNRVHDADNLIASLKGCQDGLKGIVIKDDGIDNISVTYSFDRQKPRQIKLKIRPIEPGEQFALPLDQQTP